MRRGCISLGDVRCAKCQRIVTQAELYLVVEEEDGVEVEKGKAVSYCVDCATQKGYATVKDEKGERILTFFP